MNRIIGNEDLYLNPLSIRPYILPPTPGVTMFIWHGKDYFTRNSICMVQWNQMLLHNGYINKNIFTIKSVKSLKTGITKQVNIEFRLSSESSHQRFMMWLTNPNSHIQPMYMNRLYSVSKASLCHEIMSLIFTSIFNELVEVGKGKRKGPLEVGKSLGARLSPDKLSYEYDSIINSFSSFSDLVVEQVQSDIDIAFLGS